MVLEYQGHTSASGSLHFLLSLPEMLFLRYPQNLLPHALQSLALNICILKASMTSLFWNYCTQLFYTPATLHTSYSTFIIYFPPKCFSSITNLICYVVTLEFCWYSLNKNRLHAGGIFCLFCLLIYPELLEWCLQFNRVSLNIYWLSEFTY